MQTLSRPQTTFGYTITPTEHREQNPQNSCSYCYYTYISHTPQNQSCQSQTLVRISKNPEHLLLGTYHGTLQNQITHRSIQSLRKNTQLLTWPPNIHPYLSSLFQEVSIPLTRLRDEHHSALLSYQKWLVEAIVNACIGCNTALNTIQCLLENSTAHIYSPTTHYKFHEGPTAKPSQSHGLPQRLGVVQ